MSGGECGEVEGHSNSWPALKVAHPDWLRDASVAILVQFALKRHAELPDVPTAVELARNEEERAILSAIMNATEVGTAFFTTPGVPADRLTALRRAFDATMKDPELLADAQRINVGISPLAGQDLQRLPAHGGPLPPAVLGKVAPPHPPAPPELSRAPPRARGPSLPSAHPSLTA